MSTITKEFTKERLLKIQSWSETYGPGSNVVLPAEEAEELARIALASLEAEPVAWRYRHHNGLAPSNWRFVDSEDECNMAPNYQRQALYTAPPAPVSVPEWTNEQCLEFLSIAFRHAEIKGDLELDDIRLGVKMVNGSRTAMLHQYAEDDMICYGDRCRVCDEMIIGRSPDGMCFSCRDEHTTSADSAAMLQGADGTLTNEGTKRVGELVMWVKRLASSLRKANPDSKLQSDAMDYLSRNGLIGVEDILR